MPIKSIQVWGDSVLKGVVYDETRSRYVILRENAVALMADRLALPLKNMSRMGRTARQGFDALRQMPKEEIKDSAILFELGGNDCDFNWAEVADAPMAQHEPNTPAKEYERTMADMIEYVQEADGVPVVCTLPPLDCEKYLCWITRSGLDKSRILDFLGVPERIYRWQEYYSALALRAAAGLRCACIPLREEFLQRVRGEDTLCRDGIHPNALGHRLIADALASFAQAHVDAITAN